MSEGRAGGMSAAQAGTIEALIIGLCLLALFAMSRALAGGVPPVWTKAAPTPSHSWTLFASFTRRM